MTDETDMPEGAPAAEDEGADEQETALLPRSFFQGKDIAIGNTCEVKVEGIYEDEIAVSYVPHADEEKPAADTLEAADEGIEMMADKQQDY